MIDLMQMGKDGKVAARQLGNMSSREKTAVLHHIADLLEQTKEHVIASNQLDLVAGRESGLDAGLLDRLLLNEERIDQLVETVRSVAELPDPVGEELESRLLPNGMRLVKRRVPIGLLAVIYEARPNVTIDIAALALKTGNGVILRGGKESLHSNRALAQIIQQGLKECAVSEAAVQFVDDPDRALVRQLIRMDKYVDMLIPRGGANLHRLCRDEGTIPVITGGIGICHIFVDETADLERAELIVENAKVQRPSVCNALDTLLLHRAVAAQFIPQIARRLAMSGVSLRVTEEVAELLGEEIEYQIAGTDDFDQEWLSLILGVKIVAGIDEAIEHITEHTTEHSEAILTNNLQRAKQFVDQVNSAAVYVNASTRFTDGGQFGLGAEVAVSTQKLHARGPLGPAELTSYKWIGYGDGHIRE